MQELSQFIPAVISFIMVLIIMPPFIKKMWEQGFLGINMNRFDKAKIAELGGAVVFFGFALGAFSGIFIATYLNLFKLDLGIFFAGLCTIAIIAFIGFIDDIIGWKKGIRQWQHALFPIIAALPLMAMRITNPPISLPFIGLLPNEFFLPFGIVISFGMLYSLFAVPIGVTGASNATNMLAGLNGLEAGLALLIISTLAIISIANGKVEATIFAMSMIGALIAFLLFNWYPAKILGGDGLTLMAGASIAVISILGDMEKIGIALMVLYFIELFLKARTKFQGESFGIPQKNGILLAPEKKKSLTHYFMALGPANEKTIVKRILLAQGVICILVLIAVYFNYIEIIRI
jgi:UDP-N-acetylglucosamine--dolichyl-phosphate N-acetylglucosaminephosphotransferase